MRQTSVQQWEGIWLSLQRYSFVLTIIRHGFQNYIKHVNYTFLLYVRALNWYNIDVILFNFILSLTSSLLLFIWLSVYQHCMSRPDIGDCFSETETRCKVFNIISWILKNIKGKPNHLFKLFWLKAQRVLQTLYEYLNCLALAHSVSIWLTLADPLSIWMIASYSMSLARSGPMSIWLAPSDPMSIWLAPSDPYKVFDWHLHTLWVFDWLPQIPIVFYWLLHTLWVFDWLRQTL